MFQRFREKLYKVETVVWKTLIRYLNEDVKKKTTVNSIDQTTQGFRCYSKVSNNPKANHLPKMSSIEMK